MVLALSSAPLLRSPRQRAWRALQRGVVAGKKTTEQAGSWWEQPRQAGTAQPDSLHQTRAAAPGGGAGGTGRGAGGEEEGHRPAAGFPSLVLHSCWPGSDFQGVFFV